MVVIYEGSFFEYACFYRINLTRQRVVTSYFRIYTGIKSPSGGFKAVLSREFPQINYYPE